MTQAEEAIRLDVIDQLRWDTRVDISNIDSKSQGYRQVDGHRAELLEYHLARDMARYTPGVIDVQNALLVDLA